MAAFPEWEVGDLLTADEMNDRVPVLVYKTALESRASTTTLAVDSELSVPVKAGRIYILQSAINYSSPGTNTPDLRIGWQGPAGTSMWWGMNGLDIGAVSPAGSMVTHFSTIPNPGNRAVGAVGDSGGTSFPLQFLMHGIVTITTTGNLQFMWAQWVSSATATIVRETSFIKLTPMRRF